MSQIAEQYERLATVIRKDLAGEKSGPGASEGEIERAEQLLGGSFPESYKRFQREFGAYEGIVDIYGVVPVPKPRWNIVDITLSERTDCFPKMPGHLIAFSDNSGGDSYCFDTRRFESGECPIVFWDHAGENDQELELIAPNFLDWLEYQIAEGATFPNNSKP